MEEELKQAKADLEKERQERAEEKERLEGELAKKDALIEQKTNDVVNARKKYKKLSDMTEEEREAMTEKEIELQERQEKMEEEAAKREKENKERQKIEMTARKEAAIKKLAGDDEELAQKISDNYDRFSDSKDAYTEEAIGRLATDAYNMLGIPSTDGVGNAITQGGDGNPGNTGDRTDFSETAEGKALAEAMNLNQAKEEGQS